VEAAVNQTSSLASLVTAGVSGNVATVAGNVVQAADSGLGTVASTVFDVGQWLQVKSLDI